MAKNRRHNRRPGAWGVLALNADQLLLRLFAHGREVAGCERPKTVFCEKHWGSLYPAVDTQRLVIKKLCYLSEECVCCRHCKYAQGMSRKKKYFFLLHPCWCVAYIDRAIGNLLTSIRYLEVFFSWFKRNDMTSVIIAIL